MAGTEEILITEEISLTKVVDVTIVSTQETNHHNNNNQEMTASAEPVTVPTTWYVIALQGFSGHVADVATIPGTALVRTMITDCRKVRNI